MTLELKRSISNNIPAVISVDGQVAAFLDEHDIAQVTRRVVKLALQELLTNIVRHSSGDGGARRIDVAVTLERSRIRIVIEDDGRFFDPCSCPPPELEVPLSERKPGGLGLHLVRSSVDALRYRRSEDRNRIEVLIARDDSPNGG